MHQQGKRSHEHSKCTIMLAGEAMMCVQMSMYWLLTCKHTHHHAALHFSAHWYRAVLRVVDSS